jgi:hypothetical protein
MAEETKGEERQPMAEVLPGQSIHPLQPGWTALEAFVLVKCLDESGRSSWVYRTTNPLNREELLGALNVQVGILKKELMEEWESD